MAHKDILCRIKKYTDRLPSAEKYMTTTHDSDFATVKSLRWYPWVGKNYDKGRILMLGMSTYDKKGEISDWGIFGENSTDMSRVLVSGKRGSLVITENKPFREHKPFRAMSNMFIKVAGMPYGIKTARQFWASVAFNNHCQGVVQGRRGKCQFKKEDNNQAFLETLEILKPSICLVWTTQVRRLGFCASQYREHSPQINRAIPRIVAQPLPIVGIRHPSQFFSSKEWIEFLRADSTSKEPIERFINHLKNQSVE